MNAAEESDWWDRVAGDPSLLRANVYDGLNLHERLDAITSDIEMAGWVLELGCGPGHLIAALADEYPEVRFVGVDSSQKMINHATLLEPSGYWLVNNGRDLADLAGNMFDFAYSTNLFQHIPHLAQKDYLAQLYRVVKPGGKLRLQFVTEGDRVPLNYPTTVIGMRAFAKSAGWQVTRLDVGLIHPEWAWLTLTK